MNQLTQDLVVLCADLDIEYALKGLLSRPQALAICSVRWRIFRHPHRDPGCFTKSAEFLRPLSARYRHGLVIFDRMGSGQEQLTCEEIEESVTERLARNGWGNRAATVCLDPEVEIWVWSDSPEMDRCLGWADRAEDLRDWLETRGLWTSSAPKPEHPKKALRAALREVHRSSSASIFHRLARSVSVTRCVDPAFLKLKRTLQNWFGLSGG